MAESLLAKARTLAGSPFAMVDEVTGYPTTRDFVGALADEIGRYQRALYTAWCASEMVAPEDMGVTLDHMTGTAHIGGPTDG